MNVRANALGFDPRHFSRRKALRLALDVAIIVAGLLLWALLSHLDSNWTGLWKPDAAEDCVYLGRAGSHCVAREHSREGDGAASDQNCQSLGRAGRYCAPEPSAR